MRDRPLWLAGPVRKWNPPGTLPPPLRRSGSLRRAGNSSPARSALSCHPPEGRLLPGGGGAVGRARASLFCAGAWSLGFPEGVEQALRRRFVEVSDAAVRRRADADLDVR